MTGFARDMEHDEPHRPSALSGVAWLTVLPLAVVLAFVDEFWVVSLRVATGAIERTQAPLASWLRESILLLPLFAVAVLAAVIVALRWFGPEPRRPRTVVATGLLVAVAATLVGVGVLAASGIYDYHLQSEQAQMMAAMSDSCSSTCLAAQNHAALMLQVKSVAYGSVILLGTNVVTVGWLVAIRGGRLPVTAGTGAQPARTEAGRVGIQ